MIRLVYVFGPYRAATEYEVARNIQQARRIAELVLEATRGAFLPVTPHLNTAFMGGLAPDRQILDGCLELMRRCDCLVGPKEFGNSAGTRAELAEAAVIGLPIHFVDIDGDALAGQGLRRYLAQVSLERGVIDE